MAFDCFSSLRYLVLLIIYILAFVGMMNKNLELVGFGLMFTVNFITTFFILTDVIDMSDVGSKSDIFLAVLFSGFGLNFVSLILIIMSLYKLHTKYTLQGTPIKVSPHIRKRLDDYKIIFFTNVLTLLTLAMLFFFGERGLPFYNIVFKQSTALREMFFLCVKALFTAGTLGMSGYLVYSANGISKIMNNQLDTKPRK